MTKFDFLFGTVLGELLLCHSDNLSKALQKKSISAAEGQHISRMVIDTLLNRRFLRSSLDKGKRNGRKS